MYIFFFVSLLKPKVRLNSDENLFRNKKWKCLGRGYDSLCFYSKIQQMCNLKWTCTKLFTGMCGMAYLH